MKKKKDNYNHINRSTVDIKLFPENEYDIYHIDELQLCEFLNIWFFGDLITSKGKDSKVLKDEMWTVKEVDEKTANCLYRRKYNPVSIMIVPSYEYIDRKYKPIENRFDIKATIHSIDDSSFGMWKKNLTYEECEKLRTELIKYLNDEKIVNGDDWFEYGKSFLEFEEFDTN